MTAHLTLHSHTILCPLPSACSLWSASSTVLARFQLLLVVMPKVLTGPSRTGWIFTLAQTLAWSVNRQHKLCICVACFRAPCRCVSVFPACAFLISHRTLFSSFFLLCCVLQIDYASAHDHGKVVDCSPSVRDHQSIRHSNAFLDWLDFGPGKEKCEQAQAVLQVREGSETEILRERKMSRSLLALYPVIPSCAYVRRYAFFVCDLSLLLRV